MNLDKIFDITLYLLALTSFTAATYMIVYTMLYDNRLIEAGILLVMGMITSAYLVWIKTLATGK